MAVNHPSGPRNLAIEQARSLLFVPGHRPDRFGKALDRGADAVVLDLEDAVALDMKAQARASIAAAWPGFSEAQRMRLLVRINPFNTDDYSEDVHMLQSLPGLGAVMLPKAESPKQIEQLGQACPQLAVLPLIETAEGVAQMESLASTHGVVRLALGHLDLQADLGISCSDDEAELAPVRLAMVVTSRRACLAAPVDGVTTSIDDERMLLKDTHRSRRFGFGAKLCIHPSQVAVVHAALSPTPEECAWAQRVLQAQAASGGSAFSLDGKMVDAPVVLRARQILNRCCPASITDTS